MKHLSALLIAFSLLVSVAAAADLSSLTFEELQALREQCQMEIMTRPEWKEVTVPQGIWTIGEDIPAGTYTISPTKGSSNVLIWGAAVDDYRTAGGLIVNTALSNGRGAIGKIKLVDGNILQLRGPVILSPYKGLGF